jgi:uncharacterized protein YlzI (FlbEa/FlbD family)
MAIFAKFVMRDSGRPMFVNASFVEQVRDTDEPGLTAVYLTGRGTPVVVEEKLEVVMKQLAGAPAPLKLVVSEPAFAPEAEMPVAAEPVLVAAEPEPIAAKAAAVKPKRVARKAKPAAVKAEPAPFDAEPEPVKWAARF